MKVNLTDKGLKILGLKPNRRIVNVPTDRAYALMDANCAARDDGFMVLYRKSNPAPPSVEKKAAAKEKDKKKPGPKPKTKENATSKKAAAKEKAVK